MGSVSLNILYVLMMLASGMFFRANWFYALAVYYLLLIIMRIFLIKDTSKKSWERDVLKEFYLYRRCGILMLIMNQALAVIVGYMVKSNHGIVYNKLHLVAMMVYTVSAIIWAGFNVVKYRKFNSPLLSAAKAISLASATVSLLSLETSVVSVMGRTAQQKNLTTATGIIVCSFVLGMAMFMIARANKNIKILKRSQRK